jgi:hypothetical protein
VTLIDLGEPQGLVPIALQVDRRVTLGGRAALGAPQELSERIAIGRPQCAALDVDTVDTEARPFLEKRKDSVFWLLGLTCSFLALEDAPIDRAWLQVRLESIPSEETAEPLAWSMEPLSLTDPVQIAQSAKLSASLKLMSELVPVEVGPSTERGKTSEYTRKVPYVEAHSEGTAKPSWIFTRTKITEVRGVHRMRAVVEMPISRATRAEVSVGATLKLKKFGLISYKSELADLPEHQTVTFGATT